MVKLVMVQSRYVCSWTWYVVSPRVRDEIQAYGADIVLKKSDDSRLKTKILISRRWLFQSNDQREATGICYLIGDI